MLTTLNIKTVTGFEFTTVGTNYRYDSQNKVHYLNGSSYPDSVVQKPVTHKEVK